MNDERTRPEIFRYLDYRRWLADILDFYRETTGLSIRKLTMQARLGSTSFMSMVINGQRNLGNDAIQKLSPVLKISPQERSFLKSLILFATAESLEEKDEAYRKVLAELKKSKIRDLNSSEYEFVSKWYHVAILEALSTAWNSLSPASMAASLKISTKELESSLKLLSSMGLIEMKGSRWYRTEALLQTAAETKSLIIRSFHRQMLEKAALSLDEAVPERRFFAGLTLPLNADNYEDLKKRVEKFHKELQVHYSDIKNPDSVYQFSLQIFPLIEEFKAKDA